MFPRSVALDVELAHARADAERGITRKTTLRASIPLGKCSAKRAANSIDGCALLRRALARDECVADFGCRFLDRRPRASRRAWGHRARCSPARRRDEGRLSEAPDAFVAAGLRVSAHA